ncbi:MAG TPA: ABC transporter substrate-binding protein [Candidatus Binatia bacterium]
MQALVAGDLDIVVTSAPNVVNPRLGGIDAVMILSIIPTFIDHIISAPSITSPEQLRGKIGSVNRFGSISEMGLRLSLKRLGIDPEKDVQIVPAGGKPGAARGHFQRYCSVYDHERAVYQRSRTPRLSRSGQYGDA